MKQTQILIIVLVAVLFGAGGFFGGMKYQQSQVPVGRMGNFANRANGQNPQRANGFRPVNGEIISVDDKSITVKLADGSSKIVLLPGSVTINKAAVATMTDLKVGEKVAVFGMSNADGSETAQTVQLNPIMRGTGQ